VTSTLTLGAIVHERIAVFPVARSHLPLGLDLDFELAVLAAWSHIVVVGEGNHSFILSEITGLSSDILWII